MGKRFQFNQWDWEYRGGSWGPEYIGVAPWYGQGLAEKMFEKVCCWKQSSMFLKENANLTFPFLCNVF